MNSAALHRRIQAFRRQFGDAHYWLALHAAYPLALTPDWLYRCWASFRRDTEGQLLEIPWIAVADILLSGLCREVGFELYQMDADVQELLWKALHAEQRFGPRRIAALNAFNHEYFRSDLESPDIAVKDYARTQTQAAHLIAIARLKPEMAYKHIEEAMVPSGLDSDLLMRLAGLQDMINVQGKDTETATPLPTEVSLSTEIPDADQWEDKKPEEPHNDATANIHAELSDGRTLFIGVGGTADWILTYLKEKIRAIYGEVPSHIQFRLVDTLTPEQRINTASRLGNAVGISPTEYLHLADQPQGSFYRLANEVAEQPSTRPHLARWFKANLFTQHLAQADFNLVLGAGQHRQFGRMGMFLNKLQVLNLVQRALQDCVPTGDGETTIWIVGSVAGGTGAGTFIDMALLARKAVEVLGGSTPRILGATVLPSVFSDVINSNDPNYPYDIARAYAVMREIARFQAPVNVHDMGRDAASRKSFRFLVEYDQATRVLQDGRLFDNLVIYDQSCTNENERRSYYSQIADGMSLMLDQAVGNKLFADWINAEDGYAASFNSHRVFLPARLYEHIFCGEAVLAVIDGLLPVTSNGAPSAGSLDDRRAEAWDILEQKSSPLFKRLARLKEKSDFDQLDRDLSPQFIVDNLLCFNNAEAEYRADANPTVKAQAQKLYRSLTEGIKKYGDPDNPDDFASSKDSVVKDVARRRQTYEGDGVNSFVEALKNVQPVVRKRLEVYLDEALIAALRLRPATAEGLGCLVIIRNELAKALNQCRERAQKLGTDHRARLQTRQGEEAATREDIQMAKKPLFGKGELPRKQQAYFDAVDAAQAHWQRIRLMEWIEDLIKVAQERLDRWQENTTDWQRALDGLRQDTKNALGDIHAELQHHTLTVQSSSLGITNRPDMDGYLDVLRTRCLVDPRTSAPLPQLLMGGLKWRHDDANGLQLAGWPKRGELAPREFNAALREALVPPIAENMRRHDGMANYLEWLQDKKDNAIGELVSLLERAIQGLVDHQTTTPTRQFLFLHGDQWIPERNLGEDMFQRVYNQLSANPNISNRGLLHNLHDAYGNILFQDKNVIALLVSDKRIDYQTIPVMGNMRQSYLSVRAKDQDQLPWRTQAYHLFRCEQEVFEIERRQAKQTGYDNLPLLLGKYYPVLDEPDRVVCFVQALVTGVVREIEVGIGQKEWVIGPRDSANPVWLTEGGGDVFRALVTFVQDKKDRRMNMVADLRLDTAKAWIEQAAIGKAWGEWVLEFRDKHRDDWLNPGGISEDSYDNPRKAFIALVLDYYLRDA